MDTTGKTGIEISPGISNAQKVTAKVLHALHLEWFGAIVGDILKDTTMGITVDGQRREEPWHGTHFVECAAGKHAVELDWNTHSFMGGRALRPLKCEITVEPGRVTEVVYTIQQASTHGLSSASVEIKGTRASG